MFCLVHPAKQGKVSSRSKGQKSAALSPTLEEQKRIYAAIGNVARAYDGRDVLASVTSVHVKRLIGRHNRLFGAAVLLARAVGIPVE